MTPNPGNQMSHNWWRVLISSQQSTDKNAAAKEVNLVFGTVTWGSSIIPLESQVIHHIDCVYQSGFEKWLSKDTQEEMKIVDNSKPKPQC